MLVTPVLNEVGTIEGTIRSVTAQDILPSEWVLVSGGSTDGTDDVIRRASERYPWIRLFTEPSRGGRSFATVVHNTQRGVGLLETSRYDYLGLLDADVTFSPDYFEKLIGRFGVDETLAWLVVWYST